jgi:hypothetical protein
MPSGAWRCPVLVLCLLILRRHIFVHRAPPAHPARREYQSLAGRRSPYPAGRHQKQYDAVHDFSASVDMVPALGSTEKNHITEYKDVRAYIRYRKPSDIRLIGLMPVVRSKMFDMVSDGADFKLYIPPRAASSWAAMPSNSFRPTSSKISGRSISWMPWSLSPSISKPARSCWRTSPTRIMPTTSSTRFANWPTALCNSGEPSGSAAWTCCMARQMIFDDAGNLLTDARYSQWHPYDNVPFPKHIEINRPRDEYAMVLDLVKMDINKGIPDDQFVLDQPEGTTLQTIGPPPR